MIIKISLIFFIAVTTLVAQQKQMPMKSTSNFFTKECLERFDSKGLPELIKNQLIRAELALPKARKLYSTQNAETEALGKRLEIVERLQAIVKKNLAKNSKESLIFAWQGAEELRILLNYFAEEAKRLDALNKQPKPKLISVRDFGAIGDGKHDDGPAIQRAFDAAAKVDGQPVIVKIPTGTYLIGYHDYDNVSGYTLDNPLPTDNPFPENSVEIRTPRKRVHLQLKNVKNLTIEGGAKTKMRFTDSIAIAIRVIGGENVTLKNFSIDYINLPFTQGTITKVNNKTGALTFKLDPGYPSPAEERFLKAPSRRLTPHDATGRYGLKTYRIGKVEALSNNIFNIYPVKVKPNTKMWNTKEVNFKANIIARYDPFKYDAYAIDLRYCKFCKVENVTIHSSPGGALRTMRTYATSLIRVRVEIPNKSGRLTSTNADGCQSNGLIAPFIKDCVFSQLEDDGINFNSITPKAKEISNNGTSLLPALTGGALFVDSLTGQVHGIARLENGKSKTPLSKKIRTEKKNNWQNLSYTEKLSRGFFNGTNSKFKARPDRIITIPSLTSGGVISGCTFRNIRGLGIQLTVPNALVENCLFTGNSGSALHINAMLGWGLTFNTHNVTIRNCVFKDFRRTAISCSYHSIGKAKVLPSRQFSNLRFENNVFVQKKKASFLLQNCSNVILTGNRFFKVTPSNYVIRCKNSTAVKGLNNIFSYPDASAANSFLPVSLTSHFTNNNFKNASYIKQGNKLK